MSKSTDVVFHLVTAFAQFEREELVIAKERPLCTCGSGLPVFEGRCPKCFPLMGSHPSSGKRGT